MSSRSYRRAPSSPEWLDFHYSGYFTEVWRILGFEDEDLRALELELFENPTQAPVEPGTGGLRKIRVARPGMGKRGGARVGYAYFPEYGVILVVTVFAKNDQATLTPVQKKAVKQTLVRYQDHLRTLSLMTAAQVANLRAVISRQRRHEGRG